MQEEQEATITKFLTSEQVADEQEDPYVFADAKDVSAAKGKMYDVTFNSRRQFNRFESEYDFLMVKVFEDMQLDETMTARDLESMIKGLKKGAKPSAADRRPQVVPSHSRLLPRQNRLL